MDRNEIKNILREVSENLGEEDINLVANVGETIVKKIKEESDLAFQKGVEVGMNRHTWMKDGVTFVGNGTYTLREAMRMAAKEGLIKEDQIDWSEE